MITIIYLTFDFLHIKIYFYVNYKTVFVMQYQELYSMYQLTQILIDNTIREAKINNFEAKKFNPQRKLKTLNDYKDKIIKVFEKQISNEEFNIED